MISDHQIFDEFKGEGEDYHELDLSTTGNLDPKGEAICKNCGEWFVPSESLNIDFSTPEGMTWLLERLAERVDVAVERCPETAVWSCRLYRRRGKFIYGGDKDLPLAVRAAACKLMSETKGEG